MFSVQTERTEFRKADTGRNILANQVRTMVESIRQVNLNFCDFNGIRQSLEFYTNSNFRVFIEPLYKLQAKSKIFKFNDFLDRFCENSFKTLKKLENFASELLILVSSKSRQHKNVFLYKIF